MPYKYWYTKEPDKYSYTFTIQDEQSAREMMDSETYKNNWRVNGYVMLFWPNEKNNAFLPYYDKNGQFLYWILTSANNPDGINPHDITPQGVVIKENKIIHNQEELILPDDNLTIDQEIIDNVEEEAKKVESKPKKRGRPKKRSE
jgi:hypothetical protein